MILNKNHNALLNYFSDKKKTLLNILVLSFIACLLAIIYFLNNQINELTQVVQSLNETQSNLIQELINKEIKLQKLESTLNSMMSVSFNTQEQSLNLLQLQNEMTQSYILSLGIVVTSLFALGVLNHFFVGIPLKAFIPTPLFSIIQDYTPLFREVKLYPYSDPLNDVVWFVQIINNKEAVVWAELGNSNNYASASDFIACVLLESGFPIDIDLTALTTLDNLTQASSMI